MLRVTKAAGEFLDDMLRNVDAADGIVVRIVFGFKGLEFQISAEVPEDTVFQHDGKTVLVLDPHLSDALAQKTLDTREIGGKLTLDLH